MRSRAASSPRPDESQTLRIIEVIQAAARPERRGIPKTVSARTLADHLDVSLAWVRAWHRRGLLRGFILHAAPGEGRGRLLFLEEDVISFLQERGIEVKSVEERE